MLPSQYDNRNKYFDSIFKTMTDFSGSMFSNEKWPFTDIYVSEDKVTFEFALAGFSKDEINVSIDNKILTISYEKQDSNELEKENIHYIQKTISKKSFKKAFLLSDQVDTDNVEAFMEKGILKLSLSKKVKPIKMIEIK